MLTSIVIPVYNGAKTIEELVEKLINTLEYKNIQIVLVNDGSPDNSHEVCHDLFLQYPSIVTYINLAKNFGEHNAVMAGLYNAAGDYVVIMDDDFQNPPEEVSRLTDYAQSRQFDIVYTYYEKKQHHWARNLGSRFNNWVTNFMLDKPKDLYLSSFKCLSRFIVQEIIKYKGPFPYIDGLALRASSNIGKIKVSHEQRKEGCSNYTFRKLVNLWLNMFVNFSIMPLRVSTLLGFILSFLGIIMSISVLIEKLSHPEVPIGWPSLMIAIMVFSGVQLLILGLLGEYLGRFFLSSNQTPQFVIREFYSGDKVKQDVE
jgi:glycosyltransferase involved in cell wall biosynthesis